VDVESKEREKKMKRILLPFAVLVLLTLTSIGMAQAVSVTVTCVPESIIPGESTIITVACDQDANGSITVITPGGNPSVVSITISAGSPDSVVYPDDFSASTSEIGEYEVIVSLSGNPFKASFWVYFNVHVIPDFPLLGTAGATVAMLSGLGLHKIKRRRLK
jgi:hypothetical protein